MFDSIVFFFIQAFDNLINLLINNRGGIFLENSLVKGRFYYAFQYSGIRI